MLTFGGWHDNEFDFDSPDIRDVPWCCTVHDNNNNVYYGTATVDQVPEETLVQRILTRMIHQGYAIGGSAFWCTLLWGVELWTTRTQAHTLKTTD